MMLTPKERTIHDKGLITVLRQLHDELDAAVFAAYGWPVNLTDEEILERLVALNQERATEEKQGIIRWLRPEFQNPGRAAQPVQTEMELPVAEKPVPQPLPKGHTAQLQAVKASLAATGATSPEELAKLFIKAKPAAIAKLLDDLVTLGLVRKTGDGGYGNSG
jgi:hypothetical protein